MPKCPNCPKFTAKNVDTDPEDQSLDINNAGQVSAEFRLVNTCEDCGEELEEATFIFEGDFSDKVDAHYKEHHEGDENNRELSVEAEATRTDRTQTHDRKGRPLTGPFRYRKRYLGISVEFTVTCDRCDSEIATKTVTDELPASAFDSLV